MTTRYLICGGRDFTDKAMLDRALDNLILHPKDAVIIQGDARGADRLAGAWGLANGAEVFAVPADWEGHGNAAGLIRNKLMLTDYRPDVVIAFPGGRGTAHMVALARAAGVVAIKVVR